MKNQFKKLLLLLIIMVILEFFNLSINVYAQAPSCDRPCVVDSDCLNGGQCISIGNCQTRCNCNYVVRYRDGNAGNPLQADIPYGRNCENVFMCGECWSDEGFCFYFSPETEAATGYMSGCRCKGKQDYTDIVSLSCPIPATRVSLNRTDLKKKIDDKYTGTWIGELDLSNGYKEHAIFKICVRGLNEIEIVAHSLGYFQHAFYSGKDILVGEAITVTLKNKLGNDIRTIISLIDDKHAYVVLPEGDHFKIRKIDSHSSCRKSVKQGVASITKDEFNFDAEF